MIIFFMNMYLLSCIICIFFSNACLNMKSKLAIGRDFSEYQCTHANRVYIEQEYKDTFKNVS